MSYSKYYVYKKQCSEDGGSTWHDVVPAETAPSGTAIGTYETLIDCENSIPPSPYETQYLTIIPKGNGEIKKVSGLTFYYSYDSGTTWAEATSSTTISMTNDQKIMFKSTEEIRNIFGIGSFSANTQFEVEGNIMSLSYGDNFIGKKSIKPANYNYPAFRALFADCTGLTSIENLVLPATKLRYGCYMNMFDGCTSLTTVPSNLLPAIDLDGGNFCYQAMFRGCTSLATAPDLPAQALYIGCYREMFDGCTSLTTVPSILPATTILPESSYRYMFRGCTSLTKAPILPASIIYSYGYGYMFSGCTSLAEITCLAIDTSASNCTLEWLNSVSPTGTFIKHPDKTWSTGTSGIPSGWTVLDYTP